MITRRYELNPFHELRRFQRDLNSFFNSYNSEYEAYPSYNMWSNDNEVLITAELPGIEIKDLNITAKGNHLIIEGEKKATELSDNSLFRRNERGYGRFVKNIHLPYEVENEKVKAVYKNGILKISLPRVEESKPKKILISNE